MASTIDESVVATSAYEVNDSDFEVSDVEGDMTEDERAIKRKEKIKKKMNERVEKKALFLFNEKMKLENEKKNQQEFNIVSHAYETSNSQFSNPSNLSFTTIPMGKPPHFDGTDYAVGAKTCKCIYLDLIHIFGPLCV